MTDKQDAPAAGGESPPASISERIVIRDKRRVGVPAAASADAAPSTDAGDGTGEPVEAGPTGTVASGQSEADSVETGADGTEAADLAEPAAAAATAQAAEVGELRSTLDERTADLQRVTAEYANYRKRVERDRTVAAEQAVAMVLATLLPVLDDIDRAREHGDLNGPFASVAEQLNTAVTKFGLTAFGAKGDPFDPNRHEAVAHLTSAEVTESTCIDVMRRGYLLGDRLLRPAMVAVADPE